MLYDCWKICVMMGAICSAVSFRTLAGSSSRASSVILVSDFSIDIHGRWVFALVLQCGMVLFIRVIRLSGKRSSLC